jgi:hypothetical protein
VWQPDGKALARFIAAMHPDPVTIYVDPGQPKYRTARLFEALNEAAEIRPLEVTLGRDGDFVTYTVTTT